MLSKESIEKAERDLTSKLPDVTELENLLEQFESIIRAISGGGLDSRKNHYTGQQVDDLLDKIVYILKTPDGLRIFTVILPSLIEYKEKYS